MMMWPNPVRRGLRCCRFDSLSHQTPSLTKNNNKTCKEWWGGVASGYDDPIVAVCFSETAAVLQRAPHCTGLPSQGRCRRVCSCRPMTNALDAYDDMFHFARAHCRPIRWHAAAAFVILLTMNVTFVLRATVARHAARWRPRRPHSKTAIVLYTHTHLPRPYRVYLPLRPGTRAAPPRTMDIWMASSSSSPLNTHTRKGPLCGFLRSIPQSSSPQRWLVGLFVCF
jgi:hypothetical protein